VESPTDDWLCGACGYIVTKSLPRSARCPECGGVLTEVGVVDAADVGRRRRLLLATLLGVAILIAALLWTGGSMWTARSQYRQAIDAASSAEAAARQRAEAAVRQAYEEMRRSSESARSANDSDPDDQLDESKPDL